MSHDFHIEHNGKSIGVLRMAHRPQRGDEVIIKKEGDETRYVVRRVEYRAWTGSLGTGGASTVLVVRPRKAPPTSFEEAIDAAYLEGKRRFFIDLLHLAMRQLWGAPKLQKRLALMTEREEAKAVLRRVCAKYGDNAWGEGDHLADVIEKHLERPLREAFGKDGEESPPAGGSK